MHACRIAACKRRGRGLCAPSHHPLQAKGYVARSAFKLQEIQQKHKLIPPGGQVLDLGCHPGAWLQVGGERARCLKRAGRVSVHPGSALQPSCTLAWGKAPGCCPACQRWCRCVLSRAPARPAGLPACAAVGQPGEGHASTARGMAQRCSQHSGRWRHNQTPRAPADLSCCPRPWRLLQPSAFLQRWLPLPLLQVACESLGPTKKGGRVIGVDIQVCLCRGHPAARLLACSCRLPCLSCPCLHSTAVEARRRACWARHPTVCHHEPSRAAAWLAKRPLLSRPPCRARRKPNSLGQQLN